MTDLDGLFDAVKGYCEREIERRVAVAVKDLQEQIAASAGRDGLPGQDGRDGRDGQDGAPGRDALTLEVLDEIDCTRLYRRGTFARHAGGLVRAYRTTDVFAGDLEKAGWQVVVRGVAAVECVAVDERTSVLRVAMTDGERIEHAIPKLNYRGLYRAGDYQRGDCVTYAGSVWHCERATAQAPKEGDDWVLAVKEGRPGKDAKGQTASDGKPRYLGASA